MKYFVAILFCFSVVLCANAQAQISKKTSTAAEAKETKADSAKMKAAFKELLPLIRPTPSIKERAEMNLKRMERMFKMQGIDSAKAYDSVMHALNNNQDETILYQVYSENFTPEEMKSLTAFFKSPAGKHYMEVEPRLNGAKMQIDQYVQRTINTATMSMRKPMERRAPGAPGGAPGMPPRRPGMRGMPGAPPQGVPPPGTPAPTEPAPAPPAPEPSH